MIGASLDRVRTLGRPAVRIASVEVRSTVRGLQDEDRKLVAISAGVAFLLLLQVPLVGPIANSGGALLGSDPPIRPVAGWISTVGAFGVYSGVHRVAKGTRDESVRPLLATSTSPRAVALGRSLGDFARVIGLLAAVTVIPLVALGAGAVNPSPPLALAIGGLPIAWGGLLVGRLLGLGLLWGYERLPAARVIRFVVLAALVTAWIVWWMRLSEDEQLQSVLASAVSAASVAPFRSYVRTVLAPVGVPVNPADVAVTLGIWFAVMAATVVVLRFEVRRDLAERPHHSASAGTRSAPALTAGRTELRIGWRYLLLGLRQPARFSHLLLLVIGLASAGAPAFTDPTIAIDYAPELGLLVGTAVAGGAFCLNPLGDDRAQHPLVLTSAASLAPVARGRAVAGIVLGGGAVALGLAVGLFDGRFRTVAGFLALTPVLFLASAGCALGVGAAVPSFERSDGDGPIEPSSLATIPFLVGAALAAVGAAVLVRATVADGIDPPLAVGWVGYLAVALGSGVLGYRYALGRLGGLSLESY